MEQNKVDMYIAANAKYYESHMIPTISDILQNADDSKYLAIQSIDQKDPTMLLIISLIVGHLGVDRFMIGDVGLGVAKLLTCGGLGVWTIVDWFMIRTRVKEVNFQKLLFAAQ
jgi:TM2 domain-containing membrane protein YozV